MKNGLIATRIVARSWPVYDRADFLKIAPCKRKFLFRQGAFSFDIKDNKQYYKYTMILYINTTEGHDIEIAALKNGQVLARKNFEARYSQAEKLLPEIDKLLKKETLGLNDLKAIEVENRGGSFTALRIGVITANALGFALGIPVKAAGGKISLTRKKFNIVKPGYSGEPNIT